MFCLLCLLLCLSYPTVTWTIVRCLNSKIKGTLWLTESLASWGLKGKLFSGGLEGCVSLLRSQWFELCVVLRKQGWVYRSYSNKTFAWTERREKLMLVTRDITSTQVRRVPWPTCQNCRPSSPPETRIVSWLHGVHFHRHDARMLHALRWSQRANLLWPN